jgi:hypothetical protein
LDDRVYEINKNLIVGINYGVPVLLIAFFILKFIFLSSVLLVTFIVVFSHDKAKLKEAAKKLMKQAVQHLLMQNNSNRQLAHSFNNEGFVLVKTHKKTSYDGEPYLYIGYPVNQCINNDDGILNRYKASKRK